MKLYGRSDMERYTVATPNGVHKHDFTKKRYPMPGFGDDDRSLAVLECDEPECLRIAEKHLGFSRYSDRVELTTDERDWLERADREGNVNARLMSQAFGEQLAKLAAEAGKTQ